MEDKNSRIFGLDLMRFVAIFGVLLSHGSQLLIIPGSKFLYAFGFFGVELFFVLSGFLIGGILIKTFEAKADISSLKIFWTRRWLRTLPNYYLFIFINIVVVLLLVPSDINFDKLPYFFFFLQNLAWEKPSFFRVSWSLCVEEWFYMTYPIVVLLISKIKNISVKKSFFIATLIFLIVPIFFRLYCALGPNLTFNHLRMIVISRLDAMMTGVFIAYLRFYYVEYFKKLVKPGGIVGIVIFLIVGVLYAKSNLDKLLPRTILLTFLSISFALFLPYLDSLRTSKSNFMLKSITAISLWSYSLYLVNLPVQLLMFYLRDKYGLHTFLPSFVLWIGFFSISISLSSVLYKFFELPFLAYRDRLFKGPSYLNKKTDLVKEPTII
jgi:peptidoglycan/LPS O-acetylase OafA/YrhL